MNLQVVSCNHQTADLSVRGRLAFAPAQFERAYRELGLVSGGAEGVILSTCNRVELYVASDDAPPVAIDALEQFLSTFHAVPREEFSRALVHHQGPAAVRHLFEVASSLDSMVLGEPQIVNQVKEAYTLAQGQSATGPVLHGLFQGALRVGKRVRTETKLAEGRVSIASVAVIDFGKSIFQSFHDKTVLVIGAGEMAADTLRYLHDEGVRQILVTNRTAERAHALAEVWGGQVLPFEQLDESLTKADVIVTTTGAEPRLVDRARFAKVRERTGPKPVFVLDLGVPRDFDPAIRDFDDNVFLYCIDDLEAICEQNRKTRVKEIERARHIIEQEVSRFLSDAQRRSSGPIIKRLREQWHDVMRLETARLFQRCPHLESDRAEIERTIELMMNKLMHPPLEALRDDAESGSQQGLLAALQRLFGV